MQLLSSLFAVALCLPYALAIDFVVAVGRNETSGQKGIGFSPSVALPVVGDTIVFQFQSGEHSVMQSSFETPCLPITGGFTSQIFTVADSAALGDPSLPTARLLIQDTGAKWQVFQKFIMPLFFDAVSGECNQGAVFAINPTAAQTSDAFKANAAKSPTFTPTTSGSSNGAAPTTSSPSAPPPPVGSGVALRPVTWLAGVFVLITAYIL